MRMNLLLLNSMVSTLNLEPMEWFLKYFCQKIEDAIVIFTYITSKNIHNFVFQENRKYFHRKSLLKQWPLTRIKTTFVNYLFVCMYICTAVLCPTIGTYIHSVANLETVDIYVFTLKIRVTKLSNFEKYILLAFEGAIESPWFSKTVDIFAGSLGDVG
jgi:hypothetical protein